MANTKVTGDLIASSTIATGNIADNAVTSDKISGITTAHITEGSNLYYTDARADARVALVVDSAPSTLNTLNELAAALGDDPNYAATTAVTIGTKLPLAGGTLTGGLTGTTAGFSGSITASGNSNSFGNTTIAALSASSGTFSASVTAAGNSNSFGNTTFVGSVTSTEVKVVNSSATSTLYAESDTLALVQLKDDGLNKTYNIEIGRSSTAGDLTFRSSSGEKVRFTEAGHVGIGITPSKKLTVFGSGAGNATVQIEGEGGADPYINFLANNAQHWSLGIDDSDSDKFKLSEHSALGTNDYFVVDTSGNATFAGTINSGRLFVEQSGADMIDMTRTGVGNYRFAISSSDAFSLFDVGANTDRLVINSSGNVGIGTTSPGANLEISGGGGEGSPLLRFTGSASATFNWISSAMHSNLAAGETSIHLFGQAESSKNSGYIGYLYSGAGSDSNAVTIGHYASNHLVNVLANGNVGIGTTSPENKLHILRSSADTASQLMVQNGSTGDAAIKFNVSGQSYVVGIDYDDSKKFKIASSSNLGTTDRVTLLSTGNVGIGTITPATTLEVAGAITLDGAAAGGTSTYFDWRNNGSTFAYSGSHAAIVSGGGANNFVPGWCTGSNSLIFGTANAERMRINSSGNVGIGTTSPIAQLDVGGNVSQHHSGSTTHNGGWRNIQNLGVAGWLDQTYSAGRIKVFGYENGSVNISYCEYYVIRHNGGFALNQIGTRLQVGNGHGAVDVQISGSFLQVKNTLNSSIGAVRIVFSGMKD